MDTGLQKKSIPYISLCIDVIYGLASGMTIKFFPLFFKNEVNLSPIHVQSIYIIQPILMALASKAAQSFSRTYGRVQVLLAAQSMGIALLFFMALPRFWHDEYIIVPVYIIRTVLMNCGYALQKSILMDYVAKKDRGKWNSLDGITKFGWSGSAVLGGILVDQHGYGGTFIITAVVQLMAWSLYWVMLPLVPLEKHHDELPHHVAHNVSSLKSPLLGFTTAGEILKSPMVGRRGGRTAHTPNGEANTGKSKFSDLSENLLQAPLLDPVSSSRDGNNLAEGGSSGDTHFPHAAGGSPSTSA